MFVRRLVLLVMTIVGASAICLAQLDTATLLGTVTDSSGGVIPGAKVQVQNTGTAVTMELVTDQSGNFTAPLLPVGTYKVTATMAGFKAHVQDNISLSAYDRVNLSISLSPGSRLRWLDT